MTVLSPTENRPLFTQGTDDPFDIVAIQPAIRAPDKPKTHPTSPRKSERGRR